MMKVEGICRCGNKLIVMFEFGKGATGCDHCDTVCILNPKSCEFCKALEDKMGDAEYYGYDR